MPKCSRCGKQITTAPMRWIPVTERMPKLREKVLALIDGPDDRREAVITACFPYNGQTHANGEYRISRPDTDNLQKLLKDCMTAVGFWKDDAQVCSEIVEKFWSEIPGIAIRVEEIENDS